MKEKRSPGRYPDNQDQILRNHTSFLKNHLFLILDLILLVITITGVSLFQNQADLVLIISWFIMGIYTLSCKRYNSFLHLILSTCIAFLWVYSARNYYGYNYTYYSVAGMNLLPLAAWSLGLLCVSEILNHFVFDKKIVRLLIFTLVFWSALLLLETYAFHVIRIRNISTGNNTGLPFCNCIHAPWWMRIVYFSMGPVYYTITIIADRHVDKYKKSRLKL